MKRKGVFSEAANTKAKRKISVNNENIMSYSSNFGARGSGNQELFPSSCLTETSPPAVAVIRECSPDIWSFEERRAPAQAHIVLQDLEPYQDDETFHQDRNNGIIDRRNETKKNGKNCRLKEPSASLARTYRRQSIFTIDRTSGNRQIRADPDQLRSPDKHRDYSRQQRLEISGSYFRPDHRGWIDDESGIKPSQRIDDSNEEDECSVLESSIIDEKSPVKKVEQKRFKRRSSKSTRSRPVPIEVVQPSEPSVTESSTQEGQDIGLSQHISEDLSSQSIASPLYQTPTTQWFEEDKTPCADVEINEFKSPSQGSKKNECKRRKVAKSLLEEFKFNKQRHDTSARLFSHDLRRSGKYEGTEVMNLIIRNVTERNDRLVRTIAYNWDDRKDRFIVFKSSEPSEIVEGTCMKLYKPWEEVKISATKERVIIGADCYKILRGKDVFASVSELEEVSKRSFPEYKLIRTSKPLFMDVVPDALKSTKTIKKQLAKFSTVVDINVLILNVWNHSSMSLLLIKDSDGVLSFLQIVPVAVHSSDLFAKGKLVELSRIKVAGKVTVSEKLSAFSILFSYGGGQTYFYMFKFDKDSNVKATDTSVTIPPGHFDPNSDTVNIKDINDAIAMQDRRVSLKCQLKEKGDDYILVTDETDLSLKIQIVFDPVYDVRQVPCKTNSFFHLQFLRLIHGLTIWDHFTTCQEISDIDDEPL